MIVNAKEDIMELDEILNLLYVKGYVVGDQKGEVKEKHTTKAHTDILKWIKGKLPPKKDASEKALGSILFNRGHNNYRQQTLKNLGIKKEE